MGYDKEERRRQYIEKLKDPRWQKMRLQVFERDKWACRFCTGTSETLNVHHLYYTRGNEPWDYPLSAFVTLCEDCHEMETERRPEAERQLLEAFKKRGVPYMLIEDLAHWIGVTEPPYLFGDTMMAIQWVLSSPDLQRTLVDGFQKMNSGAKVRISITEE